MSYGGGNCGKLAGGAALPCEGPNFRAGAGEACVVARNYLFPDVRDVVVDAYALLDAASCPRTWQYGETGRAHGGRLWPHHTHQNGLAADFFVPVVSAGGGPELLYISPLNKFGYGLDFDAYGTLGAQHIDWRALGQHLLALKAAGLKRKVHIERVILTPAFHAPLFEALPELRRLEPLFMKQEARGAP